MTTPNKSESSTIEELKTKLQESEQRNKDLEVKLFEKSSVTSKFSNWQNNFTKIIKYTSSRSFFWKIINSFIDSDFVEENAPLVSNPFDFDEMPLPTTTSNKKLDFGFSANANRSKVCKYKGISTLIQNTL